MDDLDPIMEEVDFDEELQNLGNQYKADLAIDFAKLHYALRDQALQYMKWSEKWANAIARRDKAQEALEVQKALLDRGIREEADAQGRKITENGIAALLKAHPDMVEARNNVISLTEQANILQSTKIAFEARKKALEGLVQLYVNGYFAAPNLPKEYKETVGAAVDQQLASKQREALEKNERLKRRKIIVKKGD